ncbi:hypothetical protein KW805_00565 [Candidatus Pacearchaeota archaeon]|nr:hypothetical protein [Candidatus Pacearchaeota archaeon]
MADYMTVYDITKERIDLFINSYKELTDYVVSQFSPENKGEKSSKIYASIKRDMQESDDISYAHDLKKVLDTMDMYKSNIVGITGQELQNLEAIVRSAEGELYRSSWIAPSEIPTLKKYFERSNLNVSKVLERRCGSVINQLKSLSKSSEGTQKKKLLKQAESMNLLMREAIDKYESIYMLIEDMLDESGRESPN